MHDRDCLHRFLFEHYPIRGHLVHLDASWRALLEHREYPDSVRDTLGEAVAASVLLAATLKFDGTLSLQLKGAGPMHLLLAQCSDQLGVRAVARYRDEIERRDLAGMSGEGHLTVTLENDDLTQRYQGVVPLSGERLSDCLRSYFESSEQLPTRLWLHATESGASGLLLQRLPADAATAPRADGSVRQASPAEVEDAWSRVQLLADTLKPEEIETLRDHQILRRLFAEDDVRLFEPAPVFFRCRCSRERVASMLNALGAEEVRSILAEQGRVEVRCDFCNRAYHFDPVDVEHLLATGSATDLSSRRH
ncbi:MAG: Hsp33 family molecular chaperone HslO [Steroidobacteraceae bacterium]|jgi:molecular chaperone Hsp33|nr:Hsp33 family molecular chaperone HslO [Steroidobacteraceae bacterium]